MAQALGGDYLHWNKKNVPVMKFQGMSSFGATEAQSYGDIVTNDVIDRHIVK